MAQLEVLGKTNPQSPLGTNAEQVQPRQAPVHDYERGH